MSRKISNQLHYLNNSPSETCTPQIFVTKAPLIQEDNQNLLSSPTNSINNNFHHPNAHLKQFNAINRRKFSFPVALHSSLLLSESPALSARRRLSNVSDVVTRKLSNSIGWKNIVISPQEIVSQGKCLCSQYVRLRLKRAGVFNRKLGLQRLRSVMEGSSMNTVREVFETLNFMGLELERMHPRIYTNVSRLVSKNNGQLSTEESAPVLIAAIARYLFKSDITWSKVVSLFAISGSLAIDCVRQGHPDYLPKLVEGVADVIEYELVTWLSDNGGWNGLNSHVKPISTTDYKALSYSIMFFVFIIVMLFILYLLKIVGYHLYVFYLK